MLLTDNDKNLIKTWTTICERIRDLKSKETALRETLIEKYFPVLQEGTATLKLDEHYTLIANQSYNRKVNDELLDNVIRDLKSDVKKSELVRTSVALIKKGYDKLDPVQKAVFATCLTISPAKPGLKLKAHKEPKK